VKPLIVNSHGFSFFLFFYFVLEIISKPQISYLLCSHFFVFHQTFLFSFFVFFSSASLKHWRNFNTHMNIPVKLLSLLVPVDSTPLASICYNGIIKEAKARTFNYWFQNIHFSCAIFPRSLMHYPQCMQYVWNAWNKVSEKDVTLVDGSDRPKCSDRPTVIILSPPLYAQAV